MMKPQVSGLGFAGYRGLFADSRPAEHTNMGHAEGSSAWQMARHHRLRHRCKRLTCYFSSLTVTFTGAVSGMDGLGGTPVGALDFARRHDLDA
ncbi:hypothetical protein ABZ519_02620 [Streptomyces collinus]|uniref:hypothetical protein n=1 Tax=Streptomyces collinus TaxID=42684 RepID=UPI0033FC8D09